MLGLHVTISMKTGEKMAKLFDESFTDGAIVTTTNDHSNPESDRQTQFGSDLDPLLYVPIETLSDTQKVERYMKMISLPSSSDEAVSEALVGLNEIADDLDIGIAIIKNANVGSFIDILSLSPNASLRLEAARVLGNSLQVDRILRFLLISL